MMVTTRRAFIGGLGGGVFALGFGTRGAIAAALSGGPTDTLTFGALEPLVSLMQGTDPDELQRILIGKIEQGTELGTLVAAGALANARAFGGRDYTGYHCIMAMIPAFEMSRQLPAPLNALPVLKVLYRNAHRIQQMGGRREETLYALRDVPATTDRKRSIAELRNAFLARDVDAAEHALASLTQGSAAEAFDDVQCLLRENLDVHRVVLTWRVWDVMQLTGQEHARTLMRQIVRFCIHDEEERIRRGRGEPELRTLLPELVGRYGLSTKKAGTRHTTDAEIEDLSQVMFASSKREAADAVAKALSKGFLHHDVGEALSIAANSLLLNDPGRSRDEPGKPKGSVHGASVGVHASDAARAWRNIASVSNHENAVGSLIAGAYHTAGQSHRVGSDRFPYAQHLDDYGGMDQAQLLACTTEAIENGDQKRASAAAHCYAKAGCPPRALFDLLIRYAASEDGALHAEKYYHTACEEYDAGRPAFRDRQLISLARVTASEFGYPAPGYAEAFERLSNAPAVR